MNHATTVSERFNDFIQFITFSNQGTIAANSRDEQRKIIKYGHLVANILIFMNVHDQSKIMSELIQEGHVITKEQAALRIPLIPATHSSRSRSVIPRDPGHSFQMIAAR